MFIIDFDKIGKMTLKNLKMNIQKHRKVKLRQLKLIDLVFDQNNKPIFPPNGIYLLFEKSSCKYVGKSGSRSFSERISSHFDLRPTAWLNTLLKKMCGHKNHYTSREIKNAAKEAFKKFSLLLIKFPMETQSEFKKEKIKKVESLLRRYLDVQLNPLEGKKKNADMEMTVQRLISRP